MASPSQTAPLNGSFSTGTILSGPDVAVRNLPDAAPPESTADCFLCGGRTYVVTDQSVLLSSYLGITLGFISIIAFTCIWRHVKVYLSRLYLKQVAFKPPSVPHHTLCGWSLPWYWLKPVLLLTTEDIFIAAGFDAVIMLKTIEFGVQLFGPIAIICLVVLVPVHLSGDGLPTTAYDQNSLAFSRFTTANLRNAREEAGSLKHIFWLHLALAFAFVGYALFLVHLHYEDMIKLKLLHQHRGENHHTSTITMRSQQGAAAVETVAVPNDVGTQALADLHDDHDDAGPEQSVIDAWQAYQQRDGAQPDGAGESITRSLHGEPSPHLHTAPALGSGPWSQADLPAGGAPSPGGDALPSTKSRRRAPPTPGMARPVPLAHISSIQVGAFSDSLVSATARLRAPTPRAGVSMTGGVMPRRRPSNASGWSVNGDLGVAPRARVRRQPQSPLWEGSEASPSARPRSSPLTPPERSASPWRSSLLKTQSHTAPRRSSADVLALGGRSLPPERSTPEVSAPSSLARQDSAASLDATGGGGGADLESEATLAVTRSMRAAPAGSGSHRSTKSAPDAQARTQVASPPRVRHKTQPSFADAFAADDFDPSELEGPAGPMVTTSSIFTHATHRASGADGARDSSSGLPDTELFPSRQSLPDTPTLGRAGASTMPSLFSPRQSDSDAAAAPGPVAESVRGSGGGGRSASVDVRASGERGGGDPALISATSAPLPPVDAAAGSGAGEPAAEDSAHLSMLTNPIHRAHRPPMLDLPGHSDNGSVVAPSVMYTTHPGPVEASHAPMPAVTNDITVVDADQHLRNENALSELHQPSARGGKAPSPAARGVRPLKWWLTGTMDKAVQDAAPHDDWWYDTGAIMSRKPSVRFRRSVDIQAPVCNSHGEVAYHVKTAIEMQKYVVLVTDVPLAATRAQVEADDRAAAERRAAIATPVAETAAACSPPNLTQDMLRAFAETAPTPPSGAPGDARAARGPPRLWWRHGDDAPAAASSQRDSIGSAAAYVAQSTPPGERAFGSRAVGEAAAPRGAAFDDECDALLAELGAAGVPPVALTGLRSTDLRSARAQARLGGMLKRTGWLAPGLVRGQEALDALDGLFARATFPEHLHKELRAYMAKRDGGGGEAAPAVAPALRHEEALPGAPDGTAGSQAAARCRRRAAAVAEAVEDAPEGRNGAAGAAEVARNGSASGMAVERGSSAAGSKIAAERASGHEGTRSRTTSAVPIPGTTWFNDDATEMKPFVVNMAESEVDNDGSSAARADRAARVHEKVSSGLGTAFTEVFRDDHPRLLPIYNHRAVHLLLIEWDRLHQKLELVEHREERAAERQLRPRYGDAWRAHRREADVAPLTHRTGFCGCAGERVASRQHYLEAIERCEADIDKARHDTINGAVANSFFVIFDSQFAATIAAQAVLHSLDARVYRTRAAPAPDNINWPALWRSNGERRWRRPVAFVWYALIMSIPIGVFGGVLTQLANLVCKVEAENAADGAAAPPGGAATAATTTGGSFVNFCAGGSHLQRIVTQVLPAVLVIVWQNAIMPLALYGITLFESTHVSLSALDRRMLTLFFWWNCFNVFFGSMIAGSLTQQLRNLILAPGNITDVLGESLATSSNFFINYVALRAFGLVPFRLVLVHGGIWRWLGKCGGKCGCVTTARDEAAFMAPASIRYGREVGVMMLVFIVAWAYCLVSPILIVVAAIYFMSSWVVWRWQIIYVYVRCYEGGGEIWRTIVQCLMLSMLIFTFFMSCVFVAKEAFYQAAILFIVMPIVIFVVWRHFRLKYDPALKFIPLEVAARAPRVDIHWMSYVSAPLRPRCSGWHPEWGKAWESWGAPSYPCGG